MRKKKANTHSLGHLGERLASWFLSRRGYVILEKNVRVGRSEIDLICELNNTLVFVEVKLRGTGALVDASHSVSAAQRRRIVTAAMIYARRNTTSFRALRFDVIAIEDKECVFKIEHYPGCFGRSGELM